LDGVHLKKPDRVSCYNSIFDLAIHGKTAPESALFTVWSNILF